MPLPPALLKRLANRGLVNAKKKRVEDQAQKPIEEEIIAEDYDEIEEPSQYDHEPMKKPQENFWKERMKRRIMEGNNNSGYKGCPNKYNIYHKCSTFCVTKWGDGILEPDREYMKRRQRLLKKYPLPKAWQECYDAGCGVYYYWNTQDDTVSWLPPNYPKSVISKSAAVLRRELDEIQVPHMEEEKNVELTEEDIEKILNAPMSRKRSESPPLNKENSNQSNTKKPKPRDLDKTIKQKHYKHKKHSSEYQSNYRRGPREEDPLDPMDPASYSDIPRGKWSDGLITEGGSQKTGVDSTVSGTLFQQRPYPSPGDVLRANAEKKDKYDYNYSKDDDY